MPPREPAEHRLVARGHEVGEDEDDGAAPEGGLQLGQRRGQVGGRPRGLEPEQVADEPEGVPASLGGREMVLDPVGEEAGAELRQNHLLGVIDLNYLAAHRRFTSAMQRKGITLVQKLSLLQRQLDEARVRLADWPICVNGCGIVITSTCTVEPYIPPTMRASGE